MKVCEEILEFPNTCMPVPFLLPFLFSLTVSSYYGILAFITTPAPYQFIPK